MIAGTARSRALLAAVALDLLLGEPPSRFHPVAWLGTAIGTAERLAPRTGPHRQLGWGLVVALVVPAVAAVAALLGERAARRLGPLGLPVEAALLKSTFAVRALLIAGEGVRRALDAGDDEGAREALRSLVSRDTRGLSRPLLAAAAIESLAENVTDSFVAPWLAYALAGLPGAFAYRAVNTLDSMIGYRGRYEYLGKAAARLDDLLNLAPARLAAAAQTLAAPAGRGSPAGAVRVTLADRRKTASPNAGWMMAAMAGALGVRLEKTGAYVLGRGREPDPADIRRAQLLAAATAALVLLGILGAEQIRVKVGRALTPRPPTPTQDAAT